MKRLMIGAALLLTFVCSVARADSINRYEGVFTSVTLDDPFGVGIIYNLLGHRFEIFVVDATSNNLLRPGDGSAPARYCTWFTGSIDPYACTVQQSNVFLILDSQPYYFAGNYFVGAYDGDAVPNNFDVGRIDFHGDGLTFSLINGNYNEYFSASNLYESTRQITSADTPEPQSFILALTGLLGLLGLRSRFADLGG
jgi:hypothetical protein